MTAKIYHVDFKKKRLKGAAKTINRTCLVCDTVYEWVSTDAQAPLLISIPLNNKAAICYDCIQTMYNNCQEAIETTPKFSHLSETTETTPDNEPPPSLA